MQLGHDGEVDGRRARALQEENKLHLRRHQPRERLEGAIEAHARREEAEQRLDDDRALRRLRLQPRLRRRAPRERGVAGRRRRCDGRLVAPCDGQRGQERALPARCRRVFFLARFDGLSQPQIAAELGIGITTVYKDLKAALAALTEARRRFQGGPND